jgi:excisionase family DNA binding protein
MKIYTINEVAMMLHLHPVTVRRYIREGKIVAKKLSDGKKAKWRIEESQVEKFWNNLK